MEKLKFLIILFAISITIISCSSEEDDAEPQEEITTGVGANEVVFDDDNTTCTPYSSEISISPQGILSIVMNPCQNSGSKLDGYFKYGQRPAAGNYTVVGTAGEFPIAANFGDSEFSMIFYGHVAQALYSTSGTIELTVNADDDTKLDMKWTDVMMESEDGTSIKFSGNLIGI